MIDNILLAKRRQSQIEIKEHRLRVLKATMISVQDIINNFMQSILLFKAESQKENAISTESLEQLDELIKQTDERLKKLSNLQDTPEKEVGAGMMMIDYENEEESSY